MAMKAVGRNCDEMLSEEAATNAWGIAPLCITLIVLQMRSRRPVGRYRQCEASSKVATIRRAG